MRREAGSYLITAVLVVLAGTTAGCAISSQRVPLEKLNNIKRLAIVSHVGPKVHARVLGNTVYFPILPADPDFEQLFQNTVMEVFSDFEFPFEIVPSAEIKDLSYPARRDTKGRIESRDYSALRDHDVDAVLVFAGLPPPRNYIGLPDPDMHVMYGHEGCSAYTGFVRGWVALVDVRTNQVTGHTWFLESQRHINDGLFRNPSLKGKMSTKQLAYENFKPLIRRMARRAIAKLGLL